MNSIIRGGHGGLWVIGQLVAGTLASRGHARARGVTIRRDLIDVAARSPGTACGHLTLHLPAGWHRQHEWMILFNA